MSTTLPYTNISVATVLTKLIAMLNGNAQATNTALAERIVGQRLNVNGYSATGATTTKVTLAYNAPTGSTPWAVLLVRARESADPSKDLSVTTRLNFGQSGGTLYVFEPAGLSANTKYDLGFVVIYDG